MIGRKKKPDPIDVHVGGSVRRARIIAGMSQTNLGEALGLTFQQVQKYEKGANRIAVSRLVRIARVLRQPVAWFYADSPGVVEHADAAAGDPLQQLGLTGQGVDLARAFLAIDDGELKAALVRMVEAAAAVCAGKSTRKAA